MAVEYANDTCVFCIAFASVLMQFLARRSSLNRIFDNGADARFAHANQFAVGPRFFGLRIAVILGSCFAKSSIVSQVPSVLQLSWTTISMSSKS